MIYIRLIHFLSYIVTVRDLGTYDLKIVTIHQSKEQHPIKCAVYGVPILCDTQNIKKVDIFAAEMHLTLIDDMCGMEWANEDHF